MESTELKQDLSASPVPAPAEAPGKKQKAVKAPTPKKKRKWLKRVITVVVIAALAVLILRGCMAGGASVTAGSYIPAVSAKQDMLVSVTGTGTIEPNNSYKVTTLIKGEVLEAPFEEGQTVHKGDLLFRIDSKDLENSIQQMELSLRSAELSYNDMLKQQSDNTRDRNIKANAAGVITKLYVDPGDTVAAGAPIADILDRDNMKLTVPFHSAQAAAFYVGQGAAVSVDGTTNTLTGTVDSIAATDMVGAGGTLVRNVTIKVVNPGALSDASSGTATIGSSACAQSAKFEYGASKQLIAKMSGEVQTLNVKESDRVSDGQTVGVFKDVSMATQVENARIAVENAKLNLQNAKDKLEDYSVTSTIDGTVIEKNVTVGDNIDGTASTTAGVTYPAVIYDLSGLTFDLKIDELDINKIKVGQEVKITADALSGRTFTGRVDKVNINGTTTSGYTTYPVTILVDGTPDDLYPGMNVSAKIVVEDAGTVLSVPVDAVQRGSGAEGDYVFVAGAGALDDKGSLVNPAALEKRTVTLGRNDSDNIEILSGLEEGETVYIPNSASNAMAMMMGG
ncbi:MAG: HlyD family efflux transporter periplasmic adaptor subunit [Clostridia bacterium]|nr:HlyD family efflux transporter periplasmic adaptor subunit [Clostridia bacterium]